MILERTLNAPVPFRTLIGTLIGTPQTTKKFQPKAQTLNPDPKTVNAIPSWGDPIIRKQGNQEQILHFGV